MSHGTGAATNDDAENDDTERISDTEVMGHPERAIRSG